MAVREDSAGEPVEKIDRQPRTLNTREQLYRPRYGPGENRLDVENRVEKFCK